MAPQSKLKDKTQENADLHKDFMLTITDRCDSCGAQAFVWVNGKNGELLFCSHHYNKIMSSATGALAMMDFAVETVDERERLFIYEENRKTGE